MADMHIIDGDHRDGSYRIVMHFDVLDVANAAGVSYRTAIVRSGRASVSVLADGDGNGGTISAAEKTQLAAGERIEHVETIPIETGGTTMALVRATLRERYGRESARVLAELQKSLRYFGRNEARA